MRSLEGQVAIVTGAGRGIGRAIAEGYAADGAIVVGTARSADQVEDLAATITAAGGRALAMTADVTVPDDMHAVASRTIDEFGRLDILVPNAGRGGAAFLPFAEWDAAEVEKVMTTNYLGVFNTVKPCIAHLQADGGGKIIAIGSGTGQRPSPGVGPYGASKAALSLMMKSLAAELRSSSVAVNELIPGPVRTQLAGFDPEAGADVHEGFGKIIESTGEWLKDPDDVVELALLIARFPNDGPSGQVFCLNGRLL